MSARVYGRGDVTDVLVQYPQLTHEQLDALAELGERMKPGDRMALMQTYTETGGTHLYVGLPSGDEFHVAANGNVVDLGAH